MLSITPFSFTDFLHISFYFLAISLLDWLLNIFYSLSFRWRQRCDDSWLHCRFLAFISIFSSYWYFISLFIIISLSHVRGYWLLLISLSFFATLITPILASASFRAAIDITDSAITPAPAAGCHWCSITPAIISFISIRLFAFFFDTLTFWLRLHYAVFRAFFAIIFLRHTYSLILPIAISTPLLRLFHWYYSAFIRHYGHFRWLMPAYCFHYAIDIIAILMIAIIDITLIVSFLAFFWYFPLRCYHWLLILLSHFAISDYFDIFIIFAEAIIFTLFSLLSYIYWLFDISLAAISFHYLIQIFYFIRHAIDYDYWFITLILPLWDYCHFAD